MIFFEDPSIISSKLYIKLNLKNTPTFFPLAKNNIRINIAIMAKHNINILK